MSAVVSYQRSLSGQSTTLFGIVKTAPLKEFAFLRNSLSINSQPLATRKLRKLRNLFVKNRVPYQDDDTSRGMFRPPSMPPLRRESLGRAQIEAVANGIPVLTSDGGVA